MKNFPVEDDKSSNHHRHNIRTFSLTKLSSPHHLNNAGSIRERHSMKPLEVGKSAFHSHVIF
jgi:hypothetical protein